LLSTTFTPFSPWGELLATTASNNPPWQGQGQVPTTGFTLATDSTYTLPPLGLAGHIYDREVGLVQMHHRSYSPRLGHFLTPDYRAPDIYDPSTFTEPYAYAAGNPMLYWDPDGRQTEESTAPKTGEKKSYLDKFLDFFLKGFGANENEETQFIDSYLKNNCVDIEDDPAYVNYMVQKAAENYEDAVAMRETYAKGAAYAEVAAVSGAFTPVDVAVTVDDMVAYGPHWYHALAFLPVLEYIPNIKSIPKKIKIPIDVSAEKPSSLNSLLSPEDFHGRAAEIIARTKKEWRALDGFQMTARNSGNELFNGPDWEKIARFKYKSFEKLNGRELKIAKSNLDRFRIRYADGTGTPIHQIRNVRHLEGAGRTSRKSGQPGFRNECSVWGFGPCCRFQA